MADAPDQPVIGIDLGGTNMQFGVVDAGNRITGRARGKTDAGRGKDRVVDNIIKGIHDACRDAGVALDALGAIGIAAAGAIDMPRGVILCAPNLGWENVPLRDILQEKLPRPVVLDNDVNGAVWGEYRLGAARDRGDLLGVWVGTGIGGGLVLNGRVYHGGFFTAGEIGHTVVTPGGGPHRRTVEDRCSRSGMLREMRRLLPRHPDSPIARLDPQQDTTRGTQAIAEAYGDADPLTRHVVNKAADLLGLAIANWVTVLSLETVVVGGGVTEALGYPYLERIRASFRENVFPPNLRDAEVLMTELEADSVLLGAALLAREAISHKP